MRLLCLCLFNHFPGDLLTISVPRPPPPNKNNKDWLASDEATA